MTKTPSRPPFTLIAPSATINEPPRKLGEHGRVFWDAVMSEYRIDDCGGTELLFQICAAVDRVEALAERISADGEVVHTRSGPRAHPALRDELAGRAFIARSLARLGITVETVKPIGRPPKSFG
jgi:hypothetical protein